MRVADTRPVLDLPVAPSGVVCTVGYLRVPFPASPGGTRRIGCSSIRSSRPVRRGLLLMVGAVFELPSTRCREHFCEPLGVCLPTTQCRMSAHCRCYCFLLSRGVRVFVIFDIAAVVLGAHGAVAVLCAWSLMWA